SILPIPMWNAISQNIGHLSFTQGILGGYLLPPADGEGGYGPLDYPMIEFQVNVPADATWSSAEITHQLDQSVVDYSLLAFYGTSLVDYVNSPMVFTVFNSEAVVDCEDLGLNIGDACDDGDENTENDVVNGDCECVGVEIVTYCTPEATNSARYINNFSTTSANENVSNLGSGFSAGGYGDFTALTVEHGFGGTVEFTAEIVGGTAGFRIWVDWNQDGEFDTENEVAYHSS